MSIGIHTGFAVGTALIAASERLDGWKSIAAYFGRDRTTVIRWARDRGLPVHRLPGGKTGTVYALSWELEHWAGLAGVEGVAEAPADPAADAAELSPVSLKAGHRRPFPWILAILSLLLLTGAVLFWPRAVSDASTAQAIPDHIASRFLAARDLVAEREAGGIERGIALLDGVVRDAPDYAPAHAARAEALLLSREFGVRDDADAFTQARIGARTALRLAPDLAIGERLLGFIAYWADADFAEASAHFSRALALDPNDALSHFWYGNMLSDHGDHAAALRALDRARLMQPGSVAIRTDLAWARWAAGDDAGIEAMRQIVQRHPDFAVAQESLAIMALMTGDEAGYVAHFQRYAQSRRDPELIARATDLQRVAQSGRTVLLRHILDLAFEDISRGLSRNHIWAATIASRLEDRGTVLAILHRAERRRERWGDAGLLMRLQRQWSGDAAIEALIRRRTSD